jgi:phage head maturation protease/regulator of replication initiation timing
MKHFYAEICKVDDEQRMVYGYASTEALDVQGEIVTKQAMAAALQDYMRFANIREMHQPSAVGVAKSVEMDDKGTFISAHVVDDNAWSKVKAGVYKGFSIGGKAIEKVDNVINALRLTEISLVDRPANPEALITLWKAEAATSDAAPSAEEAAVTQLAQMLDQGAISAQRLVALAKADAKTAVTADAAVADTTDAQVNVDPVADAAAQSADAQVGKSTGEEIWDAGQALQALGSIQYVLQKERDEMAQGEDGEEGSEAAKQVNALQTAVSALKEFIASEIQEDNAARTQDVALADGVSTQGEGAGTVHKVGRRFSGVSMQKMQAMHDSLVELGVACSTAKADASPADAKPNNVQGADVAKLAEQTALALEKVALVQAHVQRLSQENTHLQGELTRLKAMPAPGKALLNAMAISKSMDLQDDAQSASDGGFAKTEGDVRPVLDAHGQVNDAASLIKMLHAKGGVAAR